MEPSRSLTKIITKVVSINFSFLMVKEPGLSTVKPAKVTREIGRVANSTARESLNGQTDQNIKVLTQLFRVV